MSDECAILFESKQEESSPSLKTMKQSRLPFTLVNSKNDICHQKKRKLSDSDEDLKTKNRRVSAKPKSKGAEVTASNSTKKDIKNTSSISKNTSTAVKVRKLLSTFARKEAKDVNSKLQDDESTEMEVINLDEIESDNDELSTRKSVPEDNDSLFLNIVPKESTDSVGINGSKDVVLGQIADSTKNESAEYVLKESILTESGLHECSELSVTYKDEQMDESDGAELSSGVAPKPLISSSDLPMQPANPNSSSVTDSPKSVHAVDDVLMSANATIVSDTSSVLSDAISMSPTIPVFSTPKRKRTPAKPKLKTPMQLAKEAEMQKLKEERALKKEMELAEKERAKEEKERQKDDAKRKKQEEIDLKQREKEEKQKERDEKQKEKDKIVKEKEELRLKKEEERLKKEEERKKKEDERKQTEDDKRQHCEKLKAKFVSFFVPKKAEISPAVDSVSSDTGDCFAKFQVKENMRMAPLTRSNLSCDERKFLEEIVSNGTQSGELGTYLALLHEGKHKSKTGMRTWPLGVGEKKEDEEPDCEIIEDGDSTDDDNAIVMECSAAHQREKCRAKLLHFCENRRPAYWGTWTKASALVSARRPLTKDESLLDYSYDSDDDWEEEEAGESLSDSEGEEEKEKEEGDDCEYEVDNSFFVPHGYLSDDEGTDDDAEENGQQTTDVSKQIEKLKKKQDEFEEEMKQKTKQLKPRIIGCLWEKNQNNNPAYEQLLKILSSHRAVSCSEFPIGTRFGGLKEVVKESRSGGQEGEEKEKVAKCFPEEALEPLIKMIHGNQNRRAFMAREFAEFWCLSNTDEIGGEIVRPKNGKLLSRRSIENKIRELSVWEKCREPGVHEGIFMWYVSSETMSLNKLSNITLPNQWDYVLEQPKKRRVSTVVETTPKSQTKAMLVRKTPKTPLTLITKFTKSVSPGSTPNKKSVRTEDHPVIGTPIGNTELEIVWPSNSSLKAQPSLKTSCMPSISPNHSVSNQSRKKRLKLTSVPRLQLTPESSGKLSTVSFFAKRAKLTPSVLSRDGAKLNPNANADGKKKIECIDID